MTAIDLDTDYVVVLCRCTEPVSVPLATAERNEPVECLDCLRKRDDFGSDVERVCDRCGRGLGVTVQLARLRGLRLCASCDRFAREGEERNGARATRAGEPVHVGEVVVDVMQTIGGRR